MILIRLRDGIVAHFPSRMTEWVMLWPTLTMGIALSVQEDMFATSRSFSELALWADQGTWSLLVLVCALGRALALVVNGTFDAFRYSPHFRVAASLAGVFFWGCYGLGFLSAVFAGGSFSAPVAYSTLVLIEVVNVYRSTNDLTRTVRTTA